MGLSMGLNARETERQNRFNRRCNRTLFNIRSSQDCNRLHVEIVLNSKLQLHTVGNMLRCKLHAGPMGAGRDNFVASLLFDDVNAFWLGISMLTCDCL